MTKARDIASAAPAPSTVDATELGYLDGVSSAIQTQLDAKTAKSTLTTTGDIYYASSANTPARLGIGSAGNVLTVASGIPSWAAPASSLQILQIVQATYNTETASTSATLADTGLTATITPSSASNKILVLCTQAGLGKTATSALDNAITIQLNRGGSDIAKITGYAAYTGSNLEVNIGNTSINYLDAPATTSATTYKTRFKREGTGGNAKVQIDSSLSVMTLLEITGV